MTCVLNLSPIKMRSLVSLFLLSYISLTLARRSPHAGLVEELYMTGPPGSRVSNNITEDALLDIVGLITKYRYPVEVHKVTTEDGYILEMQRIPYGRDNNNRPDPQKPVVLVMHGLCASAADWVLMGPGTALAYQLAEAGYDVWLGNARGTYYSRFHTRLNPDRSNEFWNFSWEQIGTRDLPAMIDYALGVTGKSRLHYIGHSQGTTVFWTMGSLQPAYNNKIISMQALAPVAYLTNNESPLFNALAPHASSIEAVASLIGVNEILGRSDFFTDIGKQFCSDDAVTQALCSNILFAIAGRSEDMHNATMFPVKLGHTPAGISVRQLVHYGQHIRQDFFRRFDFGPLTNLRIYRSITPPSYNLRLITAPVFLHYVDDDVFADVSDVTRLFRELGRPIGMFRVPHATFSHLDFMWGTQANRLVGTATLHTSVAPTKLKELQLGHPRFAELSSTSHDMIHILTVVTGPMSVLLLHVLYKEAKRVLHVAIGSIVQSPRPITRPDALSKLTVSYGVEQVLPLVASADGESLGQASSMLLLDLLKDIELK